MPKSETSDKGAGATFEIAPAETRAGGKWWAPVVETLVAAIVVGAILYILTRSGRTFETNSILIAVLPVLFWLLASGKLASFKAFGVELKSALRQVSAEAIGADHNLMASSAIEFQPVEPGIKARIEKIPIYIQSRVPAISFELGRQDYYDGAAIRKYLDELCRHDFFKWVVFRHRDGRFAGLISAHKLRAFGELSRRSGYRSIVAGIEGESLDDLPGIIEPKWALPATSTKGQAVERFSKTDLDDLPVVDIQGRFVGVLNRGQVLGSVLASILGAARSPS